MAYTANDCKLIYSATVDDGAVYGVSDPICFSVTQSLYIGPDKKFYAEIKVDSDFESVNCNAYTFECISKNLALEWAENVGCEDELIDATDTESVLLSRLNEYIEREFGEEGILVEIPEDMILPLAHTTWAFNGVDELPIQVDFDLNEMKYIYFIEDRKIYEEESTEEDFLEELLTLSFDDLISALVAVAGEEVL